MPKPKTIKAEKVSINLRVYARDVEYLKKLARELNEQHEYNVLKDKYEKSR